MNDQKNVLLAIVLSAIVLIGWQYFIGIPQMERQRQEALQKAAQTQTQPAPGAPAPGAPTPAHTPGALAGRGADARRAGHACRGHSRTRASPSRRRA